MVVVTVGLLGADRRRLGPLSPRCLKMPSTATPYDWLVFFCSLQCLTPYVSRRTISTEASQQRPRFSMVAWRGLSNGTWRSAGLASGGLLKIFKYAAIPDLFFPQQHCKFITSSILSAPTLVSCCLLWIRPFDWILPYHFTKNGRSSNLPSNVYTFMRSTSYQTWCR